MASYRYLLESGVDGYSLEDGSGVLLVEFNLFWDIMVEWILGFRVDNLGNIIMPFRIAPFQFSPL